MKAKLGLRRAAPFQPVSITITLETQAELNALGSCFNAGNVLNGLSIISGTDMGAWTKLYSALTTAGADVHLTDAFKTKTRENK